MHTIRIDGNDIFAVYNAAKIARDIIIKEKSPVLIEAISYRGGDHTTSDFSKLYRTDKEIKKIEGLLKHLGDPITRLKKYLEYKKWIESGYIEDLREKLQIEIKDALKDAEKEPYPSVDEMFNDVYYHPTKNLKDQKAELYKHLDKYGKHYNLEKYKK